MSENDFNVNRLNGEWLQLDHQQGTMKMRQWMFDGVRMAYSDCTFQKPLTLNWQGDLEIVTMYFSLKGSVSIGGGDAVPFELGNNQQNMFYGTEAAGFMKVDELRLKSFMIQFNKDAFLRIASGGTDALKYFADCVSSGKTTAFSNTNLSVDLFTQNAIDAVMNCKFSDSLKRIFFLSKAMELMVLQAEAHTRSLSDRPTFVRTDYDKDRIIFARDYMLQHIEMPPTIPELSKIAGINAFKLKKGYKEIFGSTIFGHLAEARFDLAKLALQEGSKTVAQIAFELGYSSIQHFSTAFKKRYNVSPSQMKKNSRL